VRCVEGCVHAGYEDMVSMKPILEFTSASPEYSSIRAARHVHCAMYVSAAQKEVHNKRLCKCCKPELTGHAQVVSGILAWTTWLMRKTCLDHRNIQYLVRIACCCFR